MEVKISQHSFLIIILFMLKKTWPLCWHYARCSNHSIIPKIVPAYIVSYFRFNIMILIQGFLHAAYPAECKDELRWYALVCSYASAIILWLFHKAFLRRLVYVWILYVFCGLVPNIGIVLGFVGDSLDKNRFLGPVTLKTALCITPPILLLLVNTTSDANENKETVFKLSFRMLT